MPQLPNPALEVLWKAYNAKIPLNPEAGIFKGWAENPHTYGPPLAREIKLDEETTIQVFMNATLSWNNSRGLERLA